MSIGRWWRRLTSKQTPEDILNDRIEAFEAKFGKIANGFLRLSPDLLEFLQSQGNAAQKATSDMGIVIEATETKNAEKSSLLNINLLIVLSHLYAYAEANKMRTDFSEDQYLSMTFGEFCRHAGIDTEKLFAGNPLKTLFEQYTFIGAPVDLFNSNNIKPIHKKKPSNKKKLIENFNDIESQISDMDSSSIADSVYHRSVSQSETGSIADTVTSVKIGETDSVTSNDSQGHELTKLALSSIAYKKDKQSTIAVKQGIQKSTQDKRADTKKIIATIASQQRAHYVNLLLEIIDGKRSNPSTKTLARKVMHALLHHAIMNPETSSRTVIDEVFSLNAENPAAIEALQNKLFSHRPADSLSNAVFSDNRISFSKPEEITYLCELMIAFSTKPYNLFRQEEKVITAEDRALSITLREKLDLTLEELLIPMLTPLCRFYINALRDNTSIQSAERSSAITALLGQVCYGDSLDDILSHRMSYTCAKYLETALEGKTRPRDSLEQAPSAQEKIAYRLSISYLISKHPHYLLKLDERDDDRTNQERSELCSANNSLAKKLVTAKTMEALRKEQRTNARNDDIILEGPNEDGTPHNTPIKNKR